MDTQILTAIISGCIFGAVIAWPITRLIYMHKIKMNEMDKDREVFELKAEQCLKNYRYHKIKTELNDKIQKLSSDLENSRFAYSAPMINIKELKNGTTNIDSDG